MADEFKPIESQEALDAVIRERLERARKTEREKYADYDDLKAKAQKWDEQQEAGKSELDKARDEIARLTSEKRARDKADKASALRAKVAEETGVPASIIAGDTEEDMKSFAASVAAWARRPAAPQVPSAGGFDKGASAGGGDAKADFAAFMDDFFSSKQ